MPRAKTLAEAVNGLIPDHSLSSPEELRDLFVERPSSPLPVLQVLLETSNQTEKILFSGHRRCGKSSELAKLTHNLGDRYFVVRFSVIDRMNWSDLTYVDVLLSIGLEMFRHAFEQGVPVDADILVQFERFLKETTYTEQSGLPAAGEFGAELGIPLITKLFARLKVEQSTRRETREKVQPRLNELLDDIGLLAASIVAETGKRVLAIVEDLDKLDPKTARDLFYENGETLARPPISIIYTFPIALRHHEDYSQIHMSFPNMEVLPNIKTATKDGKPWLMGLDLCADILLRRVEEHLFTPDALQVLAHNSGGIPGVLIYLSRAACLNALVAGSQSVDIAAVSKAIQSERRDFQTRLTQDTLRLLRELQDSQTKLLENKEEYRALLHQMFCLEFWNDEVWYEVNPIVKPLLALPM